MDVVKRNITALRGTVDLDSIPGKGTRVQIRLPLTLAIIDGFLVRVCDTHYVIPLDMVIECVELTQSALSDTQGRNYINLRGEVLPFIRLQHYFDTNGSKGRRENIVVVSHAGKKSGLVVDELLGEFQTVIKPLGKLFQRLQGISGSTILGGGRGRPDPRHSFADPARNNSGILSAQQVDSVAQPASIQHQLRGPSC